MPRIEKQHTRKAFAYWYRLSLLAGSARCDHFGTAFRLGSHITESSREGPVIRLAGDGGIGWGMDSWIANDATTQ
jgi:hypothetical protein